MLRNGAGRARFSTAGRVGGKARAMNESEHNPHEALMDAVSSFDLEGVERCLAAGADPNFELSGGADGPADSAQPTTPLRMVVFRISDCDLDDGALRTFAKIAALLLRHGADPAPALKMAESRYGPYPAGAGDSAFREVWRILLDAHASPAA